MRLVFDPQAFEDLQYWTKHDRKLLEKIFGLIEECKRGPYIGRGKPEPLKHEHSGAWTRRINREHRLVYVVKGNELIIKSCRFHY